MDQQWVENNWIWIAAAAAATVIVLLLIVMMARNSKNKKKTNGLREEFRGEYDLAAQDHSKAETARALEDRKTRVEGYQVHELTPEQGRAFAARWRTVKAEFVTSPSDSVIRADELLASVMLARGYDVNVGNNDRAVDLSVGHPDEAATYREITEIARRNSRGGASTEDLRYAMVGYERLVESMIGDEIAA